jgi:hypothetical protein
VGDIIYDPFCALREIKVSEYIAGLITTAVPSDFDKALARLDKAKD